MFWNKDRCWRSLGIKKILLKSWDQTDQAYTLELGFTSFFKNSQSWKTWRYHRVMLRITLKWLRMFVKVTQIYFHRPEELYKWFFGYFPARIFFVFCHRENFFDTVRIFLSWGFFHCRGNFSSDVTIILMLWEFFCFCDNFSNVRIFLMS